MIYNKMELSPKNNWVEVLQNFSSHKEYEKLDKVDIANENSNHCNDLGSSDDEDKTLCKKVEQNLRRLSTLHGDELKSGCYYFQHWFFDNIAKKYYNGNDRGKNYAVAEKLFDIVSTLTPVYSKMEACKCYFEPGKPEDWKKKIFA
ncbi:CYIR protein [Plasmodium cynomolgi strain B]|uniref:CYIR protein n=1 Tax=Plasmodium cynomolgi (strain B) TaxID=1120755 RepID=K6UNL4_PLACD|nr:CYIR protein [Plasmodium cynomolgi strain B]GAB69603.1 CYIR protein [Plasmodium cynomolgi strain B]